MELGFDLKRLNLEDIKSKIKLDQNTAVIISVVIFIATFLIWKQFIYRVEKEESDKLSLEMQKVEFRNEVGKLKSVLESYEGKIPRINDVSWLLDKVVEIADKAHIRLTFFEPMGSENYDKYTRVAVRIKIFTTFHDLGIFIGMIESSNRFIRINGIKVSNGIKSNAAEAELIISALVLKVNR